MDQANKANQSKYLHLLLMLLSGKGAKGWFVNQLLSTVGMES